MQRNQNNHISQMLEEYFCEEKKRALEIKNHSVVSTGVKNLDIKMGHIYKGEVVLVGGRPTMGCKTFITNCIYKVAKDFEEEISSNSKNILYFNTGYRKSDLLLRLIARALKMSFRDLKNKQKEGNNVYEIFDKTKYLSSLPLYIYDDQYSIDDICDKIDQFNKSDDIGLVVIDSLQNLADYYDVGFQYQLEKIMQKINQTAKSLNIPIIVVSNLNAAVECREDDTPFISDIDVGDSEDFGGFKKIVKYSDKVLLTYRDVYRLYYNKPIQKEGETDEHFFSRCLEWDKDYNDAKNRYSIIIVKNNFGDLGSVSVFFNYSID